jgi:hypothetical protein
MNWLRKMAVVLLAALMTFGMLAGSTSTAEARGRGGGGRGGGGGGRGGGGRGGGGRGGGRGFGGGGRGGGGRSSGMTDRKDVVKDLEERRLQMEKEERITEARALGAETAYDEMQLRILDEEREKAAAKRRVEWRGRANPG